MLDETRRRQVADDGVKSVYEGVCERGNIDAGELFVDDASE
jgi:hypothetical protein